MIADVLKTKTCILYFIKSSLQSYTPKCNEGYLSTSGVVVVSSGGGKEQHQKSHVSLLILDFLSFEIYKLPYKWTNVGLICSRRLKFS